MDGTGDLFEAFAASAPAEFRPIVVRYPNTGSYDELEKLVQSYIPPDEPFAVVAESFSGPLGVRVAAAAGDRCEVLVLCNTFVSRPAWQIFAKLPWTLLFALPRPMFLVRWRLLGRHAQPALLERVRSILHATSAHVLATRIQSVLRCNEEASARSLRCRVLYLRGTEDRVVWDRVVSDTLRRLPSAVRKEISAPHLLLQTHPRAAWSAISEILRSGMNVREHR
jgi:pimeloyl-ACP methyl ester carboxylesterase